MNKRFSFTLALFPLCLLIVSPTANTAPDFRLSQIVGTGLRSSTIVSGDLNNDGHLDLAVANIFSHSITVAINNGEGGFQDVREIPLSNDLKHPVAVAIGDLDGDEFGDMAVVHIQNIENSSSPFNTADVIFLYGSADGTFTQNSAAVAGIPSNVYIHDLNGDGLNDVLVSNNGEVIFEASRIGHFDGGLYPYYNQGERNFQAGTPVVKDFDIYSIVDVAIFDYSGDGRVDVVGIDQGTVTIDATFQIAREGTRLSSFRGNAAGMALDKTITLERNPWSISTADFNDDGSTDIAVAIVGDMENATSFLGRNASVNIYRNQSGTFMLDKIVPTPGVAFNVQTADFDLDGDVDIAVTVQELNRVTGGIELIPSLRIYDNENGEFSEIASFNLEEEPRYATSGDFDGDGDIDIAVLCTILDSANANNAETGRIYIFTNLAIDETNIKAWSLY